MAGAEGENFRSIGRNRPVHGLTAGVLARVDHGVETEAGGNLGHLLVSAADIDGPGVARLKVEDLPVPAKTQDAHANKGFAAGKIDGGLEEHGVDEFDALLANALFELRNALRTEIHDGDDVVNLRQYEGVMRVLGDPVEMRQVAVGAVDALARKSGEPPATGGMEVGDDVDLSLRGNGESATASYASKSGYSGEEPYEAAPVH